MERLTASLRDNAMNIRMLPIGTTFSKFKRLVRDLSAELGKEIELTTDGAETELDKTVIERLGDPLVHLIRNSIDHGIEHAGASAWPRASRSRGTIHLSAVHSGAHVLIRIEDDGAGLDAEAIRAKAVEKGLIQPDAELTRAGSVRAHSRARASPRQKKSPACPAAEWAWTWSSGPSTPCAASIEIDEHEGRGHDDHPQAAAHPRDHRRVPDQDRGRAFHLPPLPGRGVRGAGHDRRGRTRTAGTWPTCGARSCPTSGCASISAINGDAPPIEQIVIAGVDGRQGRLVVDTVIGDHQTVIKSLGRFYQDVEGISGATILGDGTVALILDIPKLVRMVEQQEAQLTRGGDLS